MTGVSLVIGDPRVRMDAVVSFQLVATQAAGSQEQAGMRFRDGQLGKSLAQLDGKHGALGKNGSIQRVDGQDLAG